MRRWSSAVILALASGALAGPPTVVTWADWVGDWDGKLTWTNCAIDGPKAATFAIDASDGALSIDLSGAGGAFGKIALTEDGAGFTAQTSDLVAHLAHSKTGIDLGLELPSGCAIHAAVHRPSTGITACDRLDAWSRVEARCSRLGRPPLENPARLVRQRETWRKASGDDRSRLAAQCDARATRVEAEVADVGCAPNPDPQIGHRAPVCQALRQSAAKLVRCGNVASSISSVLETQAGQLAAIAETADDVSLPMVEQQCGRLREDIISLGQKYGCPL